MRLLPNVQCLGQQAILISSRYLPSVHVRTKSEGYEEPEWNDWMRTRPYPQNPDQADVNPWQLWFWIGGSTGTLPGNLEFERFVTWKKDVERRR